MVEIADHKLREKIVSIRTLQQFEVKVEPHSNLNQTKGTIRNRTIIRYTDEEILADLQDQNSVRITSL